MRKTGFFLLQIACIWGASVYAEDTTNGYIISAYGSALKSSYGECVHTAYYDADIDSRAECGDEKPVASAPVIEKPKVVLETVTMSDADKVLFNFNAATLTADGIAEMTAFAKKLGAQPDITAVTIDGYTDKIGSSDYNLKLSNERANTVKQYFIQNGIAANLIRTNGYGEKDASVSDTCANKYGNDDMNQIWQLEAKLNNKKYKGKNAKSVKEKKHLQARIRELESKRSELIACMAPDRRVIFTIEHTKQVEKTITENASAPAVSPLPKPAGQ